MKTYEIKSDQVSTLHNCVLDVKTCLRQMEEMFKSNSQIVKSLQNAVRYLEPVIKELMDKKDRDFDRSHEYFQQVEREYKFQTIWSMYEIDSLDEQSHVPVGSILKAPYYSNHEVVVNDSSWLGLWKAVDELAKKTGGLGDHVFIEGFYRSQTNDNVYEVSLGS